MSTASLFLLNPANEAYMHKQAPRPAFKQSSNLEIGIVLTLFIVSLVAFLMLALPAWKTALELQNAGAAAQARVAGIRFEDRDVEYFYVLYSFDVGGQTYQREQKVDLDQLETLVDNDQSLHVLYVSHNPNVSQLGAPYEDFGDFRVPGTIGGAIWLTMLLISLVVSVDRRMQNDELTAKGRLVKGTVVSSAGNKPGADGGSMQILTLLLSPAYYRMRKRNQSQFKVKIRYQFISPVSSKEVTKTETAVRNDLDPRYLPDPGTTVAILYRSDKQFRLM